MRSSTPSPPGPPVESTGTPVARHDDRSARLRRQSERSARLSRTALGMTGAVTLGAAVSLWFLHPSGLAIALVLFGLVLVALGLVQQLLLRREERRWPDEAILWPDGVELLLHNGEVRAVGWNDPHLAFDLFRRPVPGESADEILLEWKMGGYVPPCPLTEDGFDRVLAAAVAHDLGMAEFRHGRRRHEIRIFEVRPARRIPTATPTSPGGLPADP